MRRQRHNNNNYSKQAKIPVEKEEATIQGAGGKEKQPIEICY
jgi:hypothetical protein